MTKNYGGYNIKMTNSNDFSQPLRIPQEMIIKVEKISKKLNISKNDVFKIAIAMFLSKYDLEE